MFQKAGLLVAGVGIAAGGVLAAGPVQAAPAEGGDTADLAEYFATEVLCKDAGELRKQYQKWTGFQCTPGKDPADTTRAVWFLVPLHGVAGAVTTKADDFFTDHLKPMITDSTNRFCDLVFKSPCL